MRISKQTLTRAALVVSTVALLMLTGLGADEPPEVSSEPAPSWKTVAASGPVEAQRPADEPVWTPLRRGDRLDPQSTVRTGRRGRATLTYSGDVVIVDPDSLVELPDALGSDGQSVTQTSGSVIYEIDRRDGRDFKVFTPYLVAGVKGTTFMVTVTDSYASVTVEDGLVEVTSHYTGESMNVGPGESVLLDAAADAEIEHVTLNAKGGRGDSASDKELRKLSRAHLRRIGYAAAQRSELLFDEREESEEPEESEDERDRQDDLDDLDDLSPEEVDPGLVDDQSRKIQPTQNANQP